MWIMVAGPYASGTADEATRAARSLPWNRAALALFGLRHVPVIGVNLALPLIAEAGSEAYDEIMLPLSLALAERCEACLRIGGVSTGADAEVTRFATRGLPVYRRVEDVPRG